VYFSAIVSSVLEVFKFADLAMAMLGAIMNLFIQCSQSSNIQTILFNDTLLVQNKSRKPAI